MAGGGYFTFRSYRQGGVLIDTAAACGRYLPKDRAPAGPQNALEQCISALQTLQKGAANDPRDAEILKLIGQGNKDEAKTLQVEAAQDDEDLAVSNERLGDMLHREGNTSEAIAAFERALRIYEDLVARLGDPQARVNSVVPLWRLGGLKGKAGHAELRRALSILTELHDTGRLDAKRIA